MTGVEFDVEDIDSRLMGDQLAPVRAGRRCQGRGGDAEVDGAAFVGENEKFIAAVGDAVADALLSRLDKARFGIRMGKIDEALFGRIMIAARDDTEAAAGAFLDACEPALVLLLVDEDIVGLGRAQAVTEDLQWPMIVVDPDIEEERRVRTPDDAAAGLRQDIGRSSPVSQLRTRMVKYSDPRRSALQASSRWSGECRRPPNLK